MAVKHTIKPRWATNDVVDPTSSLNNVIEPAEGKKDIGWNYLEKPARQYFNWLGRQTNQWIDYLDDALNIFAPYETDPATMEVQLNPGRINQGTDVITLAVQTSGAIAAPITDPRIDRVVVSDTTGVISVITGSESGSPVAPAFGLDTIPIAQILLYVGMTEIVNDDITDERSSTSFNGATDEIISGQWSFNNGLTQLGVLAPNEAWSASFDVIEMNSASAIMGGQNEINTLNNSYYDGVFKYTRTAAASRTHAGSGQIKLDVAASGTIDTAITWITALKAESDGTVKMLGGNLLVSPDGTDITPSYNLVHYSNSSGAVYSQWANGTTGGASGDGFLIGVDPNEIATVWNQENTDMKFGTNKLQEMYLDASTRGVVFGTPSVNEGKGVGTVNAANGFYENGLKITGGKTIADVTLSADGGIDESFTATTKNLKMRVVGSFAVGTQLLLMRINNVSAATYDYVYGKTTQTSQVNQTSIRMNTGSGEIETNDKVIIDLEFSINKLGTDRPMVNWEIYIPQSTSGAGSLITGCAVLDTTSTTISRIEIFGSSFNLFNEDTRYLITSE